MNLKETCRHLLFQMRFAFVCILRSAFAFLLFSEMKLSLQAYSNAMQFNDRPQASSHFSNQQTNQHLTTDNRVRARDRWEREAVTDGHTRQTGRQAQQTEALRSAGRTQLL